MKKIHLIINSIMTILYLGGAGLTGIFAPFSVMAFDAPGTEKLVDPGLFLLTTFTWPVMFLAAIACMWIFYAKGFHTLSLLSLLLPSINFISLYMMTSQMSTLR